MFYLFYIQTNAVDIVSNGGEGKDESVQENIVAAVAEAGCDDLDVAEDESIFKTPARKERQAKEGEGKKRRK